MARLNQLALPDETGPGLLLVAGFILADSFAHPGYIWVIADIPGIGTDTLFSIGLAQMGLVATLALALGMYRQLVAWKALSLKPLPQVDTLVAREAERISRSVVGRPVRFLISSNVLDGNAYCLPVWINPVIVLGGGVRLLFRKNPGRALSVIAHECAHIAARDVIFLLATWYLFVAYFALAVVEFVTRQVEFWMAFQSVLPDYWAQGYSTWFAVQTQLPVIVLAGLPDMLAAAAVAFVLMHFVRNREYFADERAGQAGFRQPLLSHLNGLQGKTRKKGFAPFFAFHPTTQQRAERLGPARGWTGCDGGLVFGIGFMSLRLAEIGEAAVPRVTDEPSTVGEISDAFAAISPYMWLQALPTLFLLFIILVGLTSHIRRTTLSRFAIDGSRSHPLSAAGWSAVAVSVGAAIGSFTSAETLRSVLENDFDGSGWRVLGNVSVLTFGLPTLMLAISAVWASLTTAKFPPSDRWRNRLRWPVRLFVGFVVCVLVFDLANAVITFWVWADEYSDFGKIPASEYGIFRSKLSLLEIGVLALGCIGIGTLGAAWARRRASVVAKPLKSELHPKWLLSPEAAEGARPLKHSTAETPDGFYTGYVGHKHAEAKTTIV